MKTKLQKRQRRQKRVRAKVAGTAERPRLSIFKSNSHIYAQLIDDVAGKTVLAATDTGLKVKGKISASTEVGKAIAKLALEKKIKKVVFDRGGYLYTGRVKAVAEGAREGGLEF